MTNQGREAILSVPCKSSPDMFFPESSCIRPIQFSCITNGDPCHSWKFIPLEGKAFLREKFDTKSFHVYANARDSSDVKVTSSIQPPDEPASEALPGYRECTPLQMLEKYCHFCFVRIRTPIGNQPRSMNSPLPSRSPPSLHSHSTPLRV